MNATPYRKDSMLGKMEEGKGESSQLSATAIAAAMVKAQAEDRKVRRKSSMKACSLGNCCMFFVYISGALVNIGCRWCAGVECRCSVAHLLTLNQIPYDMNPYLSLIALCPCQLRSLSRCV